MTLSFREWTTWMARAFQRGETAMGDSVRLLEDFQAAIAKGRM